MICLFSFSNSACVLSRRMMLDNVSVNTHHSTTFSIISSDLREHLSIIFLFFLFAFRPSIRTVIISSLLWNHMTFCRWSSLLFVPPVRLSDSLISSICGFYFIICSFFSSIIHLLSHSLGFNHPSCSCCLPVCFTCHSFM